MQSLGVVVCSLLLFTAFASAQTPVPTAPAQASVHGRWAGEIAAADGPQPVELVITVDAEGDPWYTMMEANKIAEFQLR